MINANPYSFFDFQMKTNDAKNEKDIFTGLSKEPPTNNIKTKPRRNNL